MPAITTIITTIITTTRTSTGPARLALRRVDCPGVGVGVVVVEGGTIIGYVKWPEPEPSSPDHPVGPSIIYGDDCQPTGSFVDGSPVITDP